MKKVLLTTILAICAYSSPVYAQITFTESDFQPVIGQIRHAETFTASPTPFLGESNAIQALAAQVGANQTYDLTPFTYDPPDPVTTEVLAFGSASPGSNVPAFSGADYIEFAPAASNPGFPGDGYGYYSIQNGTLNLHGSLATGFAQIENTPPEVLYELPLSFGDSWTSTHTETSATPAGNFSNIVNLTQTVDGWGTLITPAGSDECLRISITREVSNNGAVIATDESIEFICKDGLTAHMGFDDVFQLWGSVSYTVETFEGGGGNMNEGVLFVVDNADAISLADQVVYDQMIARELVVDVFSDDAVTTDDGIGRDLIVLSATIDEQVFVADWRETAVPLLTWDPALYPLLDLTGNQPDAYGSTSAAQQLAVLDVGHPISHGATGSINVYAVPESMTFGIPADEAVVVATTNNSEARPVLFTYDTGAAMFSTTAAPARRAGFFFSENGGIQADTDGLTLLDNTLLWLLGRESEIAAAVYNESGEGALKQSGVRQNYPNPFSTSTWIPFHLSSSSNVVLEVFDMLGRRVATLANASYPAGDHRISFQADELPNGLYHYRMKLEGGTLIRPMIISR